jgi:hypothetical protein
MSRCTCLKYYAVDVLQDVHVSSTMPLMCFKICTDSIKPVKSLLTKCEEGGLHTHTHMATPIQHAAQFMCMNAGM